MERAQLRDGRLLSLPLQHTNVAGGGRHGVGLPAGGGQVHPPLARILQHRGSRFQQRRVDDGGTHQGSIGQLGGLHHHNFCLPQGEHLRHIPHQARVAVEGPHRQHHVCGNIGEGLQGHFIVGGGGFPPARIPLHGLPGHVNTHSGGTRGGQLPLDECADQPRTGPQLDNGHGPPQLLGFLGQQAGNIGDDAGGRRVVHQQRLRAQYRVANDVCGVETTTERVGQPGAGAAGIGGEGRLCYVHILHPVAPQFH